MHTQTEIIDSLQKLGFLSDDEQLALDGDRSNSSPDYMLSLISDLDLNSLLVGNNPLNQALMRLASSSVPLSPMKEKIIEGIRQNAPLANTLVCAAKELKLNDVDKQQLKEQLKFSVHLMVLLEVMTTLMVNDVELLELGVSSFFEQRGVKNPGNMLENFSKVWENTRDFFAPVKACSVDPAIWLSLFRRTVPFEEREQKAKEFIEKHQLTGVNKDIILGGFDSYVDSQHAGLRTNIFEAVCSQQLIDSGGYDNAKTGALLILAIEGQGDQEASSRKKYHHEDYLSGSPLIPTLAPDTDDFWSGIYAHQKPGNRYVNLQNLSKGWGDSYISWNMAFITTKFPEFCHATIPKLLIPCTLNVNSENYIATRTISLWLTINFVNTLKAKESLEVPLNIGKFSQPAPKQLAEFMKIWGRENIKYAMSSLNPGSLRDPAMKNLTEAKFTELFSQFMANKEKAPIGTIQMLWGMHQIINNKDNFVANGMKLPNIWMIGFGLFVAVVLAPAVGIIGSLVVGSCWLANKIPGIKSILPEAMRKIAEFPAVAWMLAKAFNNATKARVVSSEVAEDKKIECSYSKMDRLGVQTVENSSDKLCEKAAESPLQTDAYSELDLTDALMDDEIKVGAPPNPSILASTEDEFEDLLGLSF